MSLSVDADISVGTDLLGKSVSDLQTGVEIGDSSITGTLKYVSDYTGFSSVVEEQSGHYLALHCEVPDEDGVTITVEVVGGHSGPVALDSDGIIIDRIENTAQAIRVVATKNGFATTTKTYTLAGLTLEEQ